MTDKDKPASYEDSVEIDATYAEFSESGGESLTGDGMRLTNTQRPKKQSDDD